MLEDSHWADEATLDVVTVLARRIGSLPVLLVLTSRDGEARPGHPVHAAISATRPGDSTFIALAPLSESAVASLATPCTPRPGGNPYYVTELLASRTAADLPPSVATAVQGRASRLDEDARRLVELRARSPWSELLRPGALVVLHPVVDGPERAAVQPLKSPASSGGRLTCPPRLARTSGYHPACRGVSPSAPSSFLGSVGPAARLESEWERPTKDGDRPSEASHE